MTPFNWVSVSLSGAYADARRENLVGPSPFLCSQRTACLLERVPKHLSPVRGIGQSHCHSVFHESGEVACLAGGDERANFADLFVRKGDGGRRHS